MGQRQLDPHKRYYRIREASAVVGVPAYVLRFWERQFPGLHPQRAASGHRLYRPCDLELLIQIKHLLHDRNFTIAGARKVLRASQHQEPADTAAALLSEVRQELESLRCMLEEEL